VSSIVLMYHRVADSDHDAYGLQVHPDRFVEHVEHLTRLRCVVPLAEVLQPGRATKIAITFDDGYLDNATVAAPLLAEAGLPATYFITTERLGGRRFWWDRLAAALLGEHQLPDGVDVTVGDRDLWLALNDREARRSSLFFLHRRLRPLPPDELRETVDDVLERLAVPASDDGLTMDADQLLATARTHLQLAGQREDVQRQEIMGSIGDLTSILGRTVTSFAYPFGTRSAVGDLAPRLAREGGCAVACTTEGRPVTNRRDAFRVPRLDARNRSGAELAAVIDHFSNVR
jgi:peptidoglycan/xylan/chitin deacetylase (PgdA/CDA1 family)